MLQRTDDYNYCLPQDLIAQNLPEPRDSARLLVYERSKKVIKDCKIFDLVKVLGGNDILVFNSTAVFKARLYGKIGNKPAEVLLLKLLCEDDNRLYWSFMARPGKYFKNKAEFFVSDDFVARVEFCSGDLTDSRVFSFEKSNFWLRIETYGLVPLPPYLKNSRASLEDYQTVYADRNFAQSVAAPTAGLHFTDALLDELKSRGVGMEFVVLNVGAGTFQPVKSEYIQEHLMHSESYFMPQEVADNLNIAKVARKRIIAVGTTSARVLETCIRSKGDKAEFFSSSGETDLFIYPGHKWLSIDGLITNFHLPKSTLLMLVASLIGKSELDRIYAHAIEKKYRFYSFGDAMLII